MDKTVLLNISLAETLSEVLGLPATPGTSPQACIFINEHYHTIRVSNRRARFDLTIHDGGLTRFDQFFHNSGMRTMLYHFPDGQVFKGQGFSCTGGDRDQLDNVGLSKTDAQNVREHIRRIARGALPQLRTYVNI